MLTLKQLRTVAAVAETRHFGRAAALLGITQPALSQQVAAVEEFCGTPLFDRLPRGAVLTPFGREFLARARPVIEAAGALEQFAIEAAGHPRRPLRFGLIPTVAPYLLPEIFPALRDALPEISFAVSESRTEALLEGLAEGSLDLALVATEPKSSRARLTSAPLFDDPFVLATSNAESVADPVPLNSVAPDRMLLLDEGHCFRDQSLAACGLTAEAAGKAFAATSLSTIVEFVANGQGITLLPAISLRKESAGDRIHIHELASPGAHRTLRLCWRDASPFSGTMERIADVIRGTRPLAA